MLHIPPKDAPLPWTTFKVDFAIKTGETKDTWSRRITLLRLLGLYLEYRNEWNVAEAVKNKEFGFYYHCWRAFRHSNAYAMPSTAEIDEEHMKLFNGVVGKSMRGLFRSANALLFGYWSSVYVNAYQRLKSVFQYIVSTQAHSKVRPSVYLKAKELQFDSRSLKVIIEFMDANRVPLPNEQYTLSELYLEYLKVHCAHGRQPLKKFMREEMSLTSECFHRGLTYVAVAGMDRLEPLDVTVALLLYSASALCKYFWGMFVSRVCFFEVFHFSFFSRVCFSQDSLFL